MRSSTWRLEDLRNVILNLGFVGENLHTRQIFDCKKMFDQYPNASVSMTVTPPEGEPYPGTIERDGDLVIWDVRDCDLVAEGDGEIQIVFTQEPHIARSYNARTHVCRSQVPTGSIPSGLDDYITRADQLLDEVKDTFPAGGTTGQVLAKKSDTDYDTEWVDQGGGTEDYDELENRPQIGGVTLTGNKTLHDLGAASEADVEAKYTKPETGIPASDMAAGVIPDPEDLIDDEAGSGDTDKVWSADKSASEAQSLMTEINSIEDLFDIQEGGNLFNKNGEYIENKVIKGKTGELLTEANTGVQYIPFEGAGTYTLLYPCDYYGAVRRLCLYDSTKTFLRYIEGSGSVGSNVPAPCTWTISQENSANVAYIGFPFRYTTINTAMVVKSDTYPSEYVPYGNAKCEFLGTINADNVDELDEAIDERVKETEPIRTRMKFGAHMGAAYNAPENTIPAYRIAGQQGWDYAWITGIDLSSENTMYVIHDTTVDRTTDGTGTLSEMTDAQINALNIDQTGEGYSLSDFDPSELKIPTFEQVLQMCIKYGMKMCIRLGYLPGSMNTEGKAAKWNNFKDLIDAYNVPNSDIIFYVASESASQANTVRTLFGSDAEICIFLGSSASAQDGVDWFTGKSISGNMSMIINKANVNLTAVKLLHNNGIKVYAYGEPTQTEVNNFALWGVDLVQNVRIHGITNA